MGCGQSRPRQRRYSEAGSLPLYSEDMVDELDYYSESESVGTYEESVCSGKPSTVYSLPPSMRMSRRQTSNMTHSTDGMSDNQTNSSGMYRGDSNSSMKRKKRRKKAATQRHYPHFKPHHGTLPMHPAMHGHPGHHRHHPGHVHGGPVPVIRPAIKPSFKNTHAHQGLSGWPVEQVCEWVETLGPAYEGYCDSFEESGVNGQLLLIMNVADFESMGIMNKLHIKKIMTALTVWLTPDEKKIRRQYGKKNKKNKIRKPKKPAKNLRFANSPSVSPNPMQHAYATPYTDYPLGDPWHGGMAQSVPHRHGAHAQHTMVRQLGLAPALKDPYAAYRTPHNPIPTWLNVYE